MQNFFDGVDGGLILMLIVYSGLASWLAAWLTRGASDTTAANRQALRDSLELLERLQKAQGLVSSEERRRELEIMYARVETEVADRADELNGMAQLLHERPSSQYVLLPRPYTILSAIFCAACIVFFWAGGGVLANFITEYFLKESFSLQTDIGLEALLRGVGGGIGLIALGFVWRYFAYMTYDSYALAARAKGAESRMEPQA